MKMYVKLIVLTLVMALGLGGLVGFVQWNHHRQLEKKITSYENRIMAVVEKLEVDLDEMDTVGIKEQKAELEVIRTEIQEEMKHANGTEKALYYELDYMLKYSVEMIDLMIEVMNNPWDLITGVPEQKIKVMEEEINKHGELYRGYKEQLELDTTQNLENNMAVN